MISSAFNLERQADALAQAQRHWRDQPAARQVKPAWNIVLTREAGADGAGVAAELGQRLGWPVYDRALIDRIAREMGLQTHLLDSVDERRKHWLLESVEALTAAGPVSEPRFVRRLVEALLSLSALGHCIIVGRGAAQILPAETTLRIRLVASRDHRIEAVQHGQKISHEQAAEWVDKTDRERRQFVVEHFGMDPADPMLYDLILNVSRWSSGECADIILDVLHRLEARDSDQPVERKSPII